MATKAGVTFEEWIESDKPRLSEENARKIRTVMARHLWDLTEARERELEFVFDEGEIVAYRHKSRLWGVVENWDLGSPSVVPSPEPVALEPPIKEEPRDVEKLLSGTPWAWTEENVGLLSALLRKEGLTAEEALEQNMRLVLAGGRIALYAFKWNGEYLVHACENFFDEPVEFDWLTMKESRDGLVIKQNL